MVLLAASTRLSCSQKSTTLNRFSGHSLCQCNGFPRGHTVIVCTFKNPGCPSGNFLQLREPAADISIKLFLGCYQNYSLVSISGTYCHSCWLFSLVFQLIVKTCEQAEKIAVLFSSRRPFKFVTVMIPQGKPRL